MEEVCSRSNLSFAMASSSETNLMNELFINIRVGFQNREKLIYVAFRVGSLGKCRG
jgi:hypothetical protein